MKILIVEDNELHIKAAKEQLGGHHLTIMTSFTDFLCSQGKKVKQNGSWVSLHERVDLSQFDAVLTDINLPSPCDTKEPYNAEGPTGLLIVMKALECGVPYIGAITDASHHSDDVIAKGLDMWNALIVVGVSKIYLECYEAKWTSPVIVCEEQLSSFTQKEQDLLRKLAWESKISGNPGDPEQTAWVLNNPSLKGAKNYARLLRKLTGEVSLYSVERTEELRQLLKEKSEQAPA